MKRLILAALLAAFTTGRAEARWHLDIQGGAFLPQSKVQLRSGNVEVDSSPAGGGAFAIGGGYALNQWLDLCAQSQLATGLSIWDDSVDMYSFTAGTRVFPLSTTYPIRPFLGGQLGWYRVDGDFDGYRVDDDNTRALLFVPPDDDIHRTDDTVGINLGGGVDVPITQRVSLGMDVRYHNAFDALDGFEAVTAMLNVSVWFGDELAEQASSSAGH